MTLMEKVDLYCQYFFVATDMSRMVGLIHEVAQNRFYRRFHYTPRLLTFWIKTSIVKYIMHASQQ